MSTEPVRTAIVTLILAAAAVLIAFGVDLTDTQTGAIAGLAVAIIGVGELVRSKVTPTGK